MKCSCKYRAMIGVLSIFRVGFIAILIVVALFFVMPKYNDAKLDRFADQLYTLDLPAETELLSRSKELQGPSSGGGGHFLDFCASITIRSNLSQQQLQEYYGDLKGPKNHESGVRVYHYDGDKYWVKTTFATSFSFFDTRGWAW